MYVDFCKYYACYRKAMTTTYRPRSWILQKVVFKCLTETAKPCVLAILKNFKQITKNAYEFAKVLMHNHLLSYIQLKLLFGREDNLDSWGMWT